MKRTLHLSLAIGTLAIGTQLSAQRYITEVFTPGQVVVTPDIVYGHNIDFYESNLAAATVPAEVVELQTAVTLGNEILRRITIPEMPLRR